MSERKITIKQKMVLECIDWFIKENGYSPTYRELADELDCAIGTVFPKVSILIEKGYISCSNGRARTLRVIKKYD